jgi:hypothetical protein
MCGAPGVKCKPKPSNEYTAFQSALRQVLKMSKSDLNQMLANEKIANQGKPLRMTGRPSPKVAIGRALISNGHS